METFGFGKQQNLESSSSTYGGPSGRPSSLKKRGGKGSTNQSNPTILSGLYRVFFKTDDHFQAQDGQASTRKSDLKVEGVSQVK